MGWGGIEMRSDYPINPIKLLKASKIIFFQELEILDMLLSAIVTNI